MVLQSDIQIPTDGIRLQVPNTHLFIENTDYGKGTLCVAESHLVWRLDNGQGLCFEYPQISLHAVSNDLNAFPHECLYVMVEIDLLKQDEVMAEENDADSDYINDDDDMASTELRFVPEDKSTINPLFLAMNDCQALHPDIQSDSENENGEEDEEEEDDDDNDEEYTNVPDLQVIGTGQPIYQRLPYDENNEQQHTVKNGNHSDADQFEDAD